MSLIVAGAAGAAGAAFSNTHLIDSICVSRVSRHLELDVYSSHLLRTTPFGKLSDLDYVVDSALTAGTANDGLFVRSRERKVQRERTF